MGFADAARAERLLRTDLRAIDPDPQGAEFGDAGDRPKPDAVLAALASRIVAPSSPATVCMAPPSRIVSPERCRSICPFSRFLVSDHDRPFWHP